MRTLPPAEVMLANAALGWLELGLPNEAQAELQRIAPPFQRHPVILELRWRVAHDLADWEQALAIAREEIQCLPTEPMGYIHQAYALRRIRGGGLEKAHNALLPAARLFPELDLVHYNLACYTAQMGRLEEAWQWWRQALKVTADTTCLMAMALKDDDLRPLWSRIRELSRKPDV
ncbi:MAG: hypothetical protein N3J91_09385 [Verrucomicrobiae bacterium]|nr:hypothetical protein [Verrucomicrobiae bacterium]